jgi:hypothetical protein
MSTKSVRYFDRRTFKRNIETGFITQSDYDNYIKNLPDESDNFEEIPFEEPDELPFTAEELGLVEPSGDSFSAFSESISQSEDDFAKEN